MWQTLKICCFWFLCSGYKLLETNELCNDHGLIQVCYPDECRDQAAKFLNITDFPFEQINKSEVPWGCQVFGQELYYNNYFPGDRHPNAAPICWT